MDRTIPVVIIAAILAGGCSVEPPAASSTPEPTGTSSPVPSATMTSTHTPAPTLTFTPEPQTRIREVDGAEMVYIYPGEFIMGITEERFQELLEVREQEGDYWIETLFLSAVPEHPVYLDGYWMDRFEVTNAQFAAFLDVHGNQRVDGDLWYGPEQNGFRVGLSGSGWVPAAGYEEYPAAGVSWHAAAAYCEWVGGRLPTEAEWERAARGIDGRDYVWGEEQPDGVRANILTEWLFDTAPVGSYSGDVSPYGVMDMTGNVAEWTSDWYYQDYYAESPYENPAGHEQEYSPQGVKTLRGGHYLSVFPVNGLAYQRAANYPGFTGNAYGFRCVVDGG